MNALLPPPSKTIGYIRMSTHEQNHQKNEADILGLAHRHHLGHVDFVSETASGKISWKKRELFTAIGSLHSGDNLIVSEMSRLGRSMLDIMDVLNTLTGKGINVYAVKGDWQLKDDLQSKIMAVVFALAAEIERDLISSRTKEALKARKQQGVQLGRPKGKGKSKLDQHKVEIEALLSNGTTKTYIARKYSTTLPNLYNWLKRNELHA